WRGTRQFFEQSSLMPETASPAQASPQDAALAAALGARCVVLVGMMGAGKSTIGRRIAARLRLPFLDADTEIEAAAGMSIPDIFEIHGEPHFRDGEARVIARLLDSGPAVIATGGGAFMREETRNRIRDKAVSIWLKAEAEIIMRRVRRRADRPLRHSDPITVDVALGERAYDIVIGRDVLQMLGSRIAALRPGARTAIVTDRTVAKHWLEKTEASLAQAGIAASRIIVDEGEGS